MKLYVVFKFDNGKESNLRYFKDKDKASAELRKYQKVEPNVCWSVDFIEFEMEETDYKDLLGRTYFHKYADSYSEYRKGKL